MYKCRKVVLTHKLFFKLSERFDKIIITTFNLVQKNVYLNTSWKALKNQNPEQGTILIFNTYYN